MTRSLWLSAAAGLIVLLTQVRWDRRVVRACFLLAGGVVVSVVVVALVDRLSAESSGDWLGSAGSFLADLTSKDSASRVTRLMEWSNALDVWRQRGAQPQHRRLCGEHRARRGRRHCDEPQPPHGSDKMSATLEKPTVESTPHA